MRWSIGKRVFAALAVSSLIIVGLNAAATRWSFQRGFVDYLAAQEIDQLQEVADKLVDLHSQRNSFDSLRNNLRLWEQLFRSSGGRPAGGRPPPPGAPRNGGPPPRHGPGPGPGPGPGSGPPSGLPGLLPRVALLDAGGNRVIGAANANETVRRIELAQAGNSIGTLVVSARPGLTNEVDLAFSKEQMRSTLVIASIVLLFAGLLAALLTRQLTRPIVSLTEGARALTRGQFDRRITVVRDDELGDLAADFNELAETLQKSRQLRRRWVADISHELRTPLAILGGELQAVEDGVRQFDLGTRQSLQAEVQRLSQLVNDLHELTVSDEGGESCRRDPIHIGNLLTDCADSYRAQLETADMTVRLQQDESSIRVLGDERRLTQLFGNLIENAMRYTDAPGQLRVTVAESAGVVRIEFADSPPGVRSDQMERLFDRLYRVEESRNRASGGSGLGLSICKSIVEAHDGSIRATNSDLDGVSIEITLPSANLAEDDA